MKSRYQHKVCVLLVLALSVEFISTNQSCFPTCERKRLSYCVRLTKMIGDTSSYSQLLRQNRTLCIKCDDMDDNSVDILGRHVEKCFPEVQRLAIKGVKYGKLSAQSLVVLNSSSLLSLFINNAGITEIDDAAFNEFWKLRLLNLDHNLLKHISKHWFSPLHRHSPKDYIHPRLHRLSLSDNKICSLDPECFQHLIELESLDLQANFLTEIQSRWFSATVRLTKLLLGHNQIDTISPQAFDTLHRLQFLDLSNNNLLFLHRETILPLESLSRVSLGGNLLVSKATTFQMAWNVDMENCPFIDENRIVKQWIRVKALEVVLHINYDATNGNFSVDWFQAYRFQRNAPTNQGSCNSLSPELRLGHLAARPPFVVIAENGGTFENTSVSTQCSEAWEESVGINLGLKGGANLRLTGLKPSTEHVAFSVVATTLKNTSTVKGRGGGRSSVHEVHCFTLVHDHKRVSFFNVSELSQENATNIFSTMSVLNDNFSDVRTKVAFFNSSISDYNYTQTTQNDTRRVTTTREGQTDSTPSVVGLANSTNPLLLIVASAGPPFFLIGLLALFCYGKRRKNVPNLQKDASTLPFSGQFAHLLRRNPMYGTSSYETSPTQLGTTRNSAQTDDKTYEVINEEEVYVPSCHVYCEINDEDTSGESKPVIDTDELGKDTENENCNNVSGQDSQTENCEVEDDSVTFYAAAAEVKLSETRNAGATPTIYNTDARSCKLSNGETTIATYCDGQGRTADEMTDCAVKPK
uniref:LRRCT domain-containing protein n=1 Tax=Branchiostoma floridae TaxID=7739 RepID=C3ZH73_BRAFL|eukprot:XP_002592209.1 hypothetical protein BRAFLDRAFT_84638 [Branchiostoma floridae]